uniref:Uncharacterized protein n=1 Tax=viral metagenome TaxID=1070528 RepID=A0A6C0BN34_9ZZZZ
MSCNICCDATDLLDYSTLIVLNSWTYGRKDHSIILIR